MAKDSKGHGSNGNGGSSRTATAIMKSPSGYKEEVRFSPSKAGVAKARGWSEAVQYKAPGMVAKVHENMAKAKAHAEKHSGFVGWKK